MDISGGVDVFGLGYVVEDVVNPIVVRNGPVQTFHHEGIIFLVDSHQKGSHRTFHPQPIFKGISHLLHVVSRIGYQIDTTGDSQFI